MALSVYETKSIAIGAAGTFYPVGPINSSSGNVDEWDFVGRLPAGAAFQLQVNVPSGFPTGTSPTLDVTLESDDNAAFSSAQTRVTMRQITTAGKHLSIAFGGTGERYYRAKAVAGGTTPNFGTPLFSIIPAGDTLYSE